MPMVIEDALREKLLKQGQNELLSILEGANPEQELHISIILGPSEEKIMNTPKGEKANADLVWRLGEIAGCGPNEFGNGLRYLPVGTMHASIRPGSTASAIAKVLSEKAVDYICIDEVIEYKSAENSQRRLADKKPSGWEMN